jgi:hypothetical protein
MHDTHESYAWLRQIPGAIHYTLKQPYTSLEHKAHMLGIPEQRVAKSVYWSPRKSSEPLLCAVVAADRDVDRTSLLTALRGDHELPHGIGSARTYPTGQSPGRLGPFLTREDLGRIGGIVYDADLPRDVPLDFAHPLDPGKGLLVTLDALERCMASVFDGRVRTKTASIATPAWHAALARACREQKV